MTISDDVGASYDALVAKVTDIETSEASVAAFVTGLKAQITTLSGQLTSAGVDATKLAAVNDGLKTLASRLDAVVAADAIVATP